MMQIVFIGAGRVAVNLAQALHTQGHGILAVYSRTMGSAEALASLVGGMATDDIDQLPLQADAYIVAVKDSVLTQLVPQLARGRAGCKVFHTAGSMPMSVFEGFFSHYGVIYPMQTFSKERLIDCSRVPFFIEAIDGDTLETARSIASSVSNSVNEMSGEKRRFLHLAAVFACNFANHCYALAAEVLEAHGIPFDTMLPLIEETAQKVEQMPP